MSLSPGHLGEPRLEARNDAFRFCAGALVFLALLAAIATRITFGIDLSDESYYAIFIDDWLKGGIASSTLATLHQTAALIIYPAARLYAYLNGSADGIVLFLRTCFLAGLVLAAATWYIFLRRFRGTIVAWAGAYFVLAFIPFGLPAPSYNTIGQQGLYIALAAFGIARLSDRRDAAVVTWLILSAFAWAISVVAYPSLLAPLATFVVCDAVLDRHRRSFYLGTGLIFLALAVASAIVVGVLSWRRLYDSVIFLSAINDVGGWDRKLVFSVDLLATHRVFALVCIGGIALGVARPWIAPPLMAIFTAGLVVVQFSGPVALFCRSHDVVTVVALTGIGLVSGFHRGAPLEKRLLALVWTVSFVGGLTTMTSAFNGLFNFCIGAAPAAAAALVGLAPTCRAFGAILAAYAATIAAVATTSLTFLYGDVPEPSASFRRIMFGAFAGLAARPEQIAILDIMRDQVTPLLGDDRKIAFVGRIYGLILATPARPQALAVFPVTATMNPKGLAMESSFYQRPENRPSVCVLFYDKYIDPLNPMEPRFKKWYEHVKTVYPALGTLAIYARR